MAPEGRANSKGTWRSLIDLDRGVAPKPGPKALHEQRATGTRYLESPVVTPEPSSAMQPSAGLPRTIGNRRVSWTESASPESESRARAMDKLETLDNEGLIRLRGQVATLAIGPFDKDQQAALRKLEDIEFIGLARGIPPMQEVRPERASRPWAKQRRINVRILIEKGVRLEGSFEKAIEPHEKWREIESDIQHYKDEAKRFETELRRHAIMTALRMLTESQRGIERILRSYGLPNGAAVEAANRFAKGSELDKEVARVIQEAAASEHVDDEVFKKKRVSLVNRARRLQARQDVIRKAEEGAAMYGGAMPGVHISPERIPLGDAWVAAVREHPVLTAFRRSGEGKDDVSVDLRRLTDAPIEDVMKAVLVELIPKLAEIRRARSLLHRGPRALDPLSLPAVVALTRKNMFIPEGSLRDGVARDLADRAAQGADPKWLVLASFVLAIITFIPTGGTSIGIPIGAASIVLAAYSSGQEWEKYSSRKALSNTDINLARSLWTENPSLTWFVVSLVMAGFEVVPLVRQLRQARRVSALAAGEETADALLREAGIVKRKGKWVPEGVRRVPAADPRNVGKLAAHQSADDVSRALGKAISDEKLKVGTEELNPMMADLLGGLRYKGNPLTLNDLKNPKINLRHVRGVNGQTLNAAARDVLRQLPRAYEALRDPALVQRIAREVWEYAARHKPPLSTSKALEQLLGGHAHEVLSGTNQKFREVIGGSRPWVDLKFANDPQHGAYTHMFQELLVTRALGGNSKTAGRRFRQLIAKSEGPQIWWSMRRERKEFWSATWDALFDDLFGDGHLNYPEKLGELLHAHLDLPVWSPKAASSSVR